MGKKEETLQQLHHAKRAHISWVHRAHALIEGFPIEKEQVPISSTDCKFGIWFYGEAQQLNKIPGMDLLKEIDALHFELHDIYLKIFKIYFSDEDRTFLSKLFGNRKKITPQNQHLAREYYTKLKEISDALIGKIEKLERRLQALGEQAFV